MNMEAIAPTRQWQQKFKYEAPILDQKANRKPYRKISQVEQLHRREDITYEQFQAAEKLNKHRLGALGVKVQYDDEIKVDDELDYAITYHGQKFAQACEAVGNSRLWEDLIALIEESKSLVEIGKARGRTSHPVARAFALGRVEIGLDALVDLWGLSTSRPRTVP